MIDVAPVHETDPEVIFFTSGTTGVPKGCVLSHRSNRMRTHGHLGTVGPIMTMFPQFHWGAGPSPTTPGSTATSWPWSTGATPRPC